MRAFLHFLLSFSLFGLASYGQEYSVYEFPHDLSHGNSELGATHTDSQGFIWIATRQGVLRFDGNRFQSFSHPLSQVPAHDFFSLPSGNLIAITAQGLVEIEAGTLTPSFSPYLSGEEFSFDSMLKEYSAHLLDSRETLWLVSDKKIICYRDKEWDVMSLESLTGRVHSQVIELIEDRNRELWLFMAGGRLYHYDPNDHTWQERENPTSLSSIQSVRSNSSGDIFLGGNGVSILTIDSARVEESYFLELVDKQISQSIERMDGKMIFADQEGSLFQLIQTPDSFNLSPFYGSIGQHGLKKISLGHISHLFRSPNGDIWATNKQKLTLLQAPYFENLLQLPRYPSNLYLAQNNKAYIAMGDVYSVEKTNSLWNVQKIDFNRSEIGNVVSLCRTPGVLWLGNNGGELFRKDQLTGYIHKIELPLSSGSIFFMYPDEKENVWLSRAPLDKPFFGITRVSKWGETKHYGKEQGLSSRVIVSFQEPEGSLYMGAVGTDSYLYTYIEEEDRFENLSLPLPIRINKGGNFEVHDLCTDDTGTVFLATTHGLFVHQKDTLIKVNLGEAYTDREIRSIVKHSDGSIWLSTDKEGLLRYHQNEVIHFDESSGLPDELMTYRSLRIDKQNRIWVGTYEGIVPSKGGNPKLFSTPRPALKFIHNEEKEVPRLTEDSILTAHLPFKSSLTVEAISPTYLENSVSFQYRILSANSFHTKWSRPSQNPITQL